MTDGLMKLYPLLVLLALAPIAYFIVGRNVFYVVLSAVSVTVIASIIYLMFLQEPEHATAH